MTAEDRPRFAELLAVLSETFNEPVSETRATAYWLALHTLPLDAIRHAVSQAIQTCRFFPKPVELLEAAGDLAPDAGLIEALIVAHLRRPGGDRMPVTEPFLALVVERLGGLRMVAMMDAGARMQLLARIVPPCVAAARVRAIPFPVAVPASHRALLPSAPNAEEEG